MDIKYTLDGSEVSVSSPSYVSPIYVSDTTTVRAKAYKIGWIESDEVVQTFTRKWYECAVPEIVAESDFSNPSQEIAITCATEGGKILYTIDGSDPARDGIEYMGPFTVYVTTTVKAVAIEDDWKDSAVATKVVTKTDELGTAANLYTQTIETDSGHPWTVDTSVSRDGISSARSGSIGADGSTYMQASVKGAGTLSFYWKAKCEKPDIADGPNGYYDYGAFMVSGVVVARIAGENTEWQKFTTNITTTGKHVFRWEYRKDDSTTYAPDCIWVDCVQWIPADAEYTVTTPDPVPYSWIDKYNIEDLDYETFANRDTGKSCMDKRLHVWQEYVAGTDPTNQTSMFRALIEMKDSEPVISWDPDLNTNGVNRIYRIWGKENLSELRWSTPTNSSHRFFRVTVELP